MDKEFWVGKDMYIEVLPDAETEGIRMIVQNDNHHEALSGQESYF